MITARITLPDDPALAALLRSEQFRHKRASYRVKDEKEGIVVLVEAGDATALRTAVNSIARVIAVYEKATR